MTKFFRVEMEVWELFLSAFISATIAPGGSEVVLAYLAAKGNHSLAGLLVAATTGNTLGAMTTWGMGWMAAKKYPAESLLALKQKKALNTIKIKGVWVLFFSWLPIIGDALCFAAGWLKLPVLSGVLIILAGKFCRYLVVAWIFV